MTNDPARTPSLALAFKLIIERRLSEVHTGIPGRVEKYDKDKQLADVQPLVQFDAPQEDGTVVVETLPVLATLPVHWPAAGGMRIVLPLKQGDTGLIVFTEASIDAWQANGGLVDPADNRRFHLADATFWPGLHDDKTTLTVENGDDASFGKDGAHQVVITEDGIELGGNGNDRPSDAIALAPASKTNFDNLKDALSTFIDTFNTHTHTVSTAGTAVAQSGTTEPTLTPGPTAPTIQAIDSQKVKAK